MGEGKRNLILYWAAAGLGFLVVMWWLYFFAMQGDVLVERVGQAGVELSPSQQRAVRDAADESLMMFAFEGGFVFFIALVGFFLVVRALRREVLLHRQQRDFLSAVTHELRSPIASARAYVESIQLRRVPEGKLDIYLERTLTDLDRLNRTVDQMLVAARQSSHAHDLQLEPCDLAELARRAIERVALEAERTGARIELDVDASAAWVTGNAEAIGTVLDNLISNALKYGGEPPVVRVRVRGENGSGRVEVIDHGPGIGGADGARVFDAFVRGGDEIVKRRPGVGLGLFLVAQLTRAQNGRVTANSDDANGFTVSFSLPTVRHVGGVSEGAPA